MTTVNSSLDKRQHVESEAHKKISHYCGNTQGLEDLQELRNADNITRQDYAGRFAFELLQNGADAHWGKRG
jgi:hypothetical protein